MREIQTLTAPYDSVIALWGSFFFFDPQTNGRILADIFNLLRPGGRLLIDVMFPEYFARRPADISDERNGVSISTSVSGGRIRFAITYSSGAIDHIEFEAISPADLVERSERLGFRVRELCAGWQAGVPLTPDYSRYLAILERPS